MKSRIFFTLIIAFCLIQDLMGCEYWGIGKMYIVDENNNPVSVNIWVFNSINDSFKLGKKCFRIVDTLDHHPYTFWDCVICERYSAKVNAPANKKLLIQAEGFADVRISDLRFTGGIRAYPDLPVLIIKMYPKRYVKKGDLLTLINSYICEKSLEVKDSIVLDFDYYVEGISKANSVANAQRVATYSVKTYPNPVKDKLHIEINATITKPYNAKLLDVQGKLVSETQLFAQNSVIDMEWEVAGVYFIQVYNPDGILLYAFKFIKT